MSEGHFIPKFRGAREKDDELIFGDLIRHDCGSISINVNSASLGYAQIDYMAMAFQVKPHTVAQQTGVETYNKHSREYIEVYEADVFVLHGGCFVVERTPWNGGFNAYPYLYDPRTVNMRENSRDEDLSMLPIDYVATHGEYIGPAWRYNND